MARCGNYSKTQHAENTKGPKRTERYRAGFKPRLYLPSDVLSLSLSLSFASLLVVNGTAGSTIPRRITRVEASNASLLALSGLLGLVLPLAGDVQGAVGRGAAFVLVDRTELSLLRDAILAIIGGSP